MSLDQFDGARCVAGIHQVRKAVLSDTAEAVFIAADADERAVAVLLSECTEKNVPLDRTATKAELGAWAHLDVGAAALAMLRKH